MSDGNITLRSIAIRLLAGNGEEQQMLSEILADIPDGADRDDFAYSILLELAVIHKILENINMQRQQGEQAMFQRLSALLEIHRRENLGIVLRQQIISRKHFHKMFRIYRESFANRMIIICALTVLAVFAGLGVFYFYWLIW